MKIRSAIPENGSHIFCGRKKNKKKTKRTVKHLCIRLIGGCVNNAADLSGGVFAILISITQMKKFTNFSQKKLATLAQQRKH